MDFIIVSLKWRQSELRDKHAHPGAGLLAASAASLSDFFLPIFKRPVQLEGQVRLNILIIDFFLPVKEKKKNFR